MQQHNATLSVGCYVIKSRNGLFMVQLTDNNNIIIGHRQCHANEHVHFSDLAPGDYVISVCPCQEDHLINPLGLSRWVVLSSDCNSSQFFVFNRFFLLPQKPAKMNFTLTDRYYPNLPIKEGELILWRNIL